MASEKMVTDIPDDELVAAGTWGIWDDLLLLAIGLLAVYYIFFRSKKNAAPAELSPISNSSMSMSSNSAESSFITKMKNSGRNVVVFYGSQTGTAEEFASRLAKEASRYSLKGMVADPEECDMEELGQLQEIGNSLAIFAMATYGEGDPTDNSQEFYEWLQQGDVDLTGMKYAVFALGNKTYEHYNDMGKYLDKRLEELGATRIFELGLGDDDGNLEEDFITWKEKFWPAVCEYYGIQSTGEDISMRQYRLELHDSLPTEKLFSGEVARLHSYKTQRPPFDAKNPHIAFVSMKRELHSGGDRSCMHIEFDISNSRMRYETGDHVAVYPTNDEELVKKLGELLDTDLDTIISLINLDEDSHKKHPFPCPCSYRTALSHYLDITSPPHTHVLKELSEYTSDPEEKAFLKSMIVSSPEGKKLFHDWILNSCRNIIHVLEDLPSCRPPLDYLCELMPRLQARYYSISSSPKVHANSIHITAVLIEYETPTKRVNRGVATNCLRLKDPTNGIKPTIPLYVRKSQFRLPSKPKTPIIMIGPGTGLAPFRGFIQERDKQRQQDKCVGETILYFGCRHEKEDYLYKDELDEYVKNGTLTKLHVAFSRDQPEKIYVNHLLSQNASEVWHIIGENNGHIYVCGDARNMAREVHQIIVGIVETEGKMSKSDAFRRSTVQGQHIVEDKEAAILMQIAFSVILVLVFIVANVPQIHGGM
uniref:NADPH--cytochrome P450 reductase n=1 Tax=Strigamia maritima TaxID=126957 RepID=T1ILV8_STRMM